VTNFKRLSETAETYRLKWTAWQYLWAMGCRHIGFEVHVGNYIADVVGVERGKTVWVVEVKVSRSDFTKDCPPLDKLTASREARAHAEAMAAALTDYELRVRKAFRACCITSHWIQCPGYKWLSAQEEAARRNTYRPPGGRIFSNKFRSPMLLDYAHRFVLACPEGLVAAKELPPEWGMIHGDGAVAVKPQKQQPTCAQPERIIADIARANALAMMTAHGVRWNGMKPVWPAEALTGGGGQ
jgi:Holliday junction resolvase-like predicted endonuclease